VCTCSGFCWSASTFWESEAREFSRTSNPLLKKARGHAPRPQARFQAIQSSRFRLLKKALQRSVPPLRGRRGCLKIRSCKSPCQQGAWGEVPPDAFCRMLQFRLSKKTLGGIASFEKGAGRSPTLCPFREPGGTGGMDDRGFLTSLAPEIPPSGCPVRKCPC
jgi:hypothetical protein